MSIEALDTHSAVRDGAGHIGGAFGADRLAAMQDVDNAPWDAPATPEQALIYPDGIPDPLPAAKPAPVTAA